MRCVKFCIVVGMLPVNELKERSSNLRLGERAEGMTPEKLLFWRYMYWREGRDSTSDGRFPLRRFDRRLRIASEFSFPSKLAGIGPKRPTPGSRRANTRVLSKVQVMPAQEVQIAVEEFQLSCRP